MIETRYMVDWYRDPNADAYVCIVARYEIERDDDDAFASVRCFYMDGTQVWHERQEGEMLNLPSHAAYFSGAHAASLPGVIRSDALPVRKVVESLKAIMAMVPSDTDLFRTA